MTMLSVSDLVIDIPQRASGSPLQFAVKRGEIWGVLGPNGAGKTTLLHTLAGLRSPRSGAVQLHGQPLNQMKRREIARSMAVVFQERQDGFPATVMETTLIGRHPYLSPWDIESDDDIAIARRALEMVGLSGLETRLVSTLSGGERQRLAFATAYAQSPQLWLVDEPSNHLDLHHQVQIMRLMANQAAAGCGIFMCLHDLNLAARWCDHLLLLYKDGSACWGDTETMLQTEALETLYNQALVSTVVNGHRYFVPAESDNSGP